MTLSLPAGDWPANTMRSTCLTSEELTQASGKRSYASRCAESQNPLVNKNAITMSSNAMAPFPCLFVSAIVFGGVLRLLELYIMTSSTLEGFLDIWLGRRLGPFGLGDIVVGCGILFLLLSVFEVVTEPRSLASWMTLGFCLILMCYVVGLRYLPEGLL